MSIVSRVERTAKIMKTAEKMITGRFGIKKQCVEFSRRWLHLHRGMVYDNVKIAAEIWDKIHYYTDTSGQQKYPVINIEKGVSALPVPGDLLIYGAEFLGTGHVSVIVNVEKSSGFICVHEQNYANKYQAPYQQRCISFVNKNNRNWLQDEYVLGWKSLQKS